uniref:Arrestin C-terminal-like domain-containing protein n=1 Tax=Amphimedon queenslandica TaxID=400682 RepID=A0A1X7U4Z7_AMPQE
MSTVQTEGVELSIALSQQPQGVLYTPTSEVAGEVLLSIREGSQDLKYKRVTVAVLGKVDVYFSVPQSGGGRDGRHFTESNTFFKKVLTLWEEGQSTTSINASGSYVFPFSLSLQSEPNASLPSSLDCRDAKIRYNIEAKLIRNDTSEIESASCFKRIEIQSNVDINRGELLSPRSAQKEIMAGCISRDNVTVTSTIARTGYCRVADEIPVQVIVEPGRGTQLQFISTALIQRITCYAQGQPSILERLVHSNANTQMPRKGISFTWNVPRFTIPDQLELSLDNFSYVHIGYFIRVEFGAKCIKAQWIDLPIVIGNVPLSSANSSRLSSMEVSRTTSGGGGYRPVSGLIRSSGYNPPVIPAAAAKEKEEREEESNEYSRLIHK